MSGPRRGPDGEQDPDHSRGAESVHGEAPCLDEVDEGKRNLSDEEAREREEGDEREST